MNSLLPHKAYGKATACLLGLFVLSFGAFWALVASGERGGATYWANPLLSAPFTSAALCGVLMLFTGLISAFRDREKNIFNYVAIPLGFIVLIWISAELIAPH